LGRQTSDELILFRISCFVQLARQEPHPPKIFADGIVAQTIIAVQPFKFPPTKVGAQQTRQQLRVETRSMNGFGCVINYGLKPVA
jgi:hypothetical protein